MAAKKYYAVAVGLTPGIYEKWPDAQAQVKGVSGARYKSFPTRQEAEAWLRDPVYETKVRAQKASHAASLDIAIQPGKITVFTDGGSINNPGPGGYGVVILDGDSIQELSGGFRLTTNNRMELTGVLVALRYLQGRQKPLVLYTDSSYVVNGINKGWARGWRRRGWKKGDGSQALNADLWAELLRLIDGLDVQFCWVKGHAGNEYNERCDQLAVAAARGSDQAIDVEYEKQQ